jgi:hypothetical protein
MENNNRKRMFQLGEWLEQFLNPNIIPSRYKELSDDAISIYNIVFSMLNDLSLTTIDFLSGQPLFIQENILNRKKRTDLLDGNRSPCTEYNYDEYHKKYINQTEHKNLSNKDKESLKKTLINILKKIDDITNADLGVWLPSWRNRVKNELFNFIDIKIALISVFKEIKTNNNLWSQTFNRLLIDELEQEHTPAMGIYHHSLSIYEAIHIKGNKAVKINDFDSGTNFYANSEGGPTLFPWGVIASKIMIDFLYLGGQDYFRFCENCGRFTIVKRKGKRFCSDVCRTEFNRIGIN